MAIAAVAVPAPMEEQRSRPLPHMPKLLYRHSASCPTTPTSHNSMLAMSTSISGTTLAPTLSPSEHTPFPETPWLASSANPASPSANASNGAQRLPNRSVEPLPKKKGSSLLNFLTVKEPSTHAWLEYQANLQKHRSTQHGRVSAVGMPMVSSAKLPASVPKVNSKWDGVPDAVIQREKAKKARRSSAQPHAKQPNNFLLGSRNRSRSMPRDPERRTPPQRAAEFTGNPGASRAVSNSTTSFKDDVPWTPSSTGSKDFASILDDSLKSAPDTPLSDISLSIPDISESTDRREALVYRNPDLGHAELLELPKLAVSHTNMRMDPLLATPCPGTFSPTSTLQCSNLATSTHQSRIQTTVVALPPKDEQVLFQSRGMNILGPPSSARRRPKNLAFPADEAQEMQLPDDPPSILRKDAGPREAHEPTRPPLSSYFATATPSSTRDRRTDPTIHAMAPWDFPDSHTVIAECNDTGKTPAAPPQGSKISHRISKLSFLKY
ncbi:hypothetical protein MMC13_005696 [Lambiella insularis]|nr:hypothetical protein [Lambiella insularis]